MRAIPQNIGNTMKEMFLQISRINFNLYLEIYLFTLISYFFHIYQIYQER